MTLQTGGSSMPSDVSGYSLRSKLREDSNTVLYRGERRLDRHPVLLEMPRSQSLASRQRILNSWHVLQAVGAGSAPRPYELLPEGPVLVMENLGGKPLKQLLGRPMEVPRFLQLATKLTRAVAELHEQKITHKALTPDNILLDQATGNVRLTSFGLASSLSHETPSFASPDDLLDQLPYVSPEQTGRMNRLLDYRTDLYTLGAVFYECLTGQVPCTASDPLELVHFHIAKTPPAPRLLDSTIPAPVSDIVMKLLSKMPEERYQSALGLQADLEFCLQQLRSTDTVDMFPLDRAKAQGPLRISQQLFGRSRELQLLLDTFDRTARGTTELLLVAGYSGVGKTALVHEVHKPITAKRGRFIAGKFDQLQRNVPYSAIARALNEFIDYLLTQSDLQLAEWRSRILEAVGSSGQVLIDVIPRLELVIGAQPPVSKLGPMEAQNRFNYLFRRLIGAISRPEHPLTMFIDDLQWADSGTLKLLETLLVFGGEGQCLLLIGAYRDNEVASNHPLILTLAEIEKAKGTVNTIELQPLRLPDLNAWLAASLGCGEPTVYDLASLVDEKTAGNPFFVTQFLKSLHEDRLLVFDFATRRWQWDVALIRSKNITDNVVELLTAAIRKLPPSTQEMLQLAACLGNQCELNLLATAHGQPLRSTLGDLWQAIEEGYVIPLDESYKFCGADALECATEVKFAHDRIQQAAYSLIPASARGQAHLDIGRRLLRQPPSAAQSANFFLILNQLNAGSDWMADASERNALVRLNLEAGKRARASAAFQPALKYISAAMSLLATDAWQSQYALAYELHKARAELEYLNGDFELAEAFIEALLPQAHTPLEKAEIYDLQITVCTLRQQYPRAMQIAKNALALLDVELSPPDMTAACTAEVSEIDKIVDGQDLIALCDALPAPTNPKHQATLRLLATVSPLAFQSDLDLLFLVSAKAVRLSLLHGNTPSSITHYCCYGQIVLWVRFHDYETGYRFGKLLEHLAPKFPDVAQRCTSDVLLLAHTNHWVEHVKHSDTLYKESVLAGLESGQLQWAGYSAFWHAYNLMFQGVPLEALRARLAEFLAFASKQKDRLTVDSITGCLLRIRSFIEGIQDEVEDQHMLMVKEHATMLGCMLFWTWRMQALFVFGRARESLQLARESLPGVVTLGASISEAAFNFYHSLSMAALFEEATEGEKAEYLAAMAANQQQLKVWSDHCPSNFLNQYLLVEAERARITGDKWRAAELYDEAIASAEENEFIQNEAVAHELAARFWLESGKPHLARPYMVKAHACFDAWGAKRKVSELEGKYPELLSVSRAPRLARACPFDILTMLKAQQAISSEIVLGSLAKTLLRIAIENAGAQRGHLILARDHGLYIVASSEAGEPGESVEGRAVESSADLPCGLLKYVERTLEVVAIDDGARPNRFSSDEYIARARPRSILCVPIVRQAKLAALLYLENHSLANVFTPQRVAILELLASQAAISLQTAALFDDLHKTEESLRASEYRYAMAQRAAEIGSWDWDIRSGQWLWSDAVEPLFGFERGTFAGTYGAFLECVHPEDRQPLEQAVAAALQEQKPYSIEHRVVWPDGTVRWVAETGEVHRDAGGTPVHMFGMVQDVTARREAEAVLRESVRKRDEFLAILGHELRNPLAPIRNSAQILRLIGSSDPRVQQVGATVERQVSHVTRIVDDLLDVSRISRGKIRLKKQVLDWASLVRVAVGDSRTDIEARQIELDVDIPDRPVWVYGDPTRLTQIFANLLHNAAKFTDAHGHIWVRLEVAETQKRGVLSVRDSGVGMNEETLQGLFEPFSQAQKDFSRGSSGMGLGLALVKGFVQLHEGTVGAMSRGLGRGSEFKVSLPLSKPSEATLTQGTEKEPGSTVRVLIIEDFLDTAETLGMYLEMLGYAVRKEQQGRAGLEQAKQFHPDVVLCDIGLPGGMDGYAVARAMRGDEALSKVALVAMTGFGQDEDKRRALEAGFDIHLTKPVEPAELARILSALIRRRVSTRASANVI